RGQRGFRRADRQRHHGGRPDWAGGAHRRRQDLHPAAGRLHPHPYRRARSRGHLRSALMPDEPAAAAGLLLSDDLLFTSRVTATARAHGLAVRVVRSGSALLETARQQPPRCVLLDLGQAGPAVAELVRGLRSGPGPTMLVVAYGSHVDTETLRAA